MRDILPAPTAKVPHGRGWCNLVHDHWLRMLIITGGVALHAVSIYVIATILPLHRDRHGLPAVFGSAVAGMVANLAGLADAMTAGDAAATGHRLLVSLRCCRWRDAWRALTSHRGASITSLGARSARYSKCREIVLDGRQVAGPCRRVGTSPQRLRQSCFRPRGDLCLPTGGR